ANGPCIKIGNISSEANMAIMIIKNIKIACVYIGYLNTLKFITGSYNLNCLIENKTILITPMMMVRYTLGRKKPSLLSPVELKPLIIVPNPTEENNIDGKSIFGFVTSPTLTKNL